MDRPQRPHALAAGVVYSAIGVDSLRSPEPGRSPPRTLCNEARSETIARSGPQHETEVMGMRKLVLTVAVVVAFGITASAAAPQVADPNDNASCIAHFIEPVGTPGGEGGRSEEHGPLGFPWGKEVVSHFAVVHEGASFEECATEQN
jgi:hypothetical protein